MEMRMMAKPSVPHWSLDAGRGCYSMANNFVPMANLLDICRDYPSNFSFRPSVSLSPHLLVPSVSQSPQATVSPRLCHAPLQPHPPGLFKLARSDEATSLVGIDAAAAAAYLLYRCPSPRGLGMPSGEAPVLYLYLISRFLE